MKLGLGLNSSKFFPYARIEIVDIPDETGQGMEERILSGPVDEQLRSALSYLKNHVIAEKVFKLPDQAEAVRIKNYSYAALMLISRKTVTFQIFDLYI